MKNTEKDLQEGPVLIFDVPFTTPLQLHKGKDPVTRSNWCSFLVKSFAISTADYAKQAVYFDWMRVHTGLNYRLALRSFLQAGGWQAFSGEEQSFFLDAVEQVKRHTTYPYMDVIEEMRTRPAERLKSELLEIVGQESWRDTQPFIARFIQAHKPLEQLSEQELFHSIKVWPGLRSR